MKRYSIKKRKQFLFIALVFLQFAVATEGQDLRKSIFFSQSQLHFEKRDGYDVVTYGNLDLTAQPGAPQLPRQIIPIALPEGKELMSVRIKNIRSEILPDHYTIYPLQRPRILSVETIDFTLPDSTIYHSNEPYPKEIATIVSSGYLCGQNMGAVIVHPLQYLPSMRKLRFISSLELEFTVTTKPASAVSFKESPYARSIRDKTLHALMGESNHPSLRKNKAVFSEGTQSLHLYVIITSDNLMASFQPLAQWKTQKGLSAKIVTTSYIYAHFTGRDKEEKIRNFIIYAHKNWGTIWVLLGGDTNVIPTRYAYAFDCETGREADNYIPCDLYYADLDGDWNADGDNIFGEVADNVDMYADVFVGRAAVETATEANAFVAKVLTYEKNAPNGHELKMLFLAEVLWQQPYTNSGEGKDYIDQLFVPERFDPITKLYKHLGNQNVNSAREALNRGYNIINHDGHAWHTLLSVGEGSLQKVDMDNLRNGPKYSILFSIGCWPAAFDYDCIAEHFLTNPLGGGVAFIGNSRYGWGSPGNPLYGYSDRFDQQFFKKLFIENLTHVGSALMAAKSVYVPFARQENVYRWCEYELNLLGDPEMLVWTDQPRSLAVLHPQQLPLGSSSCAIQVTDGAKPVEGALVCLMQDTLVYVTGFTDSDGMVRLPVAIQNAAVPLQLTVTAANFLPFSTPITVVSEKPFISLALVEVNGTAQKMIQPQANYLLGLRLKNDGQLLAENVSVILSCADRSIALQDSSAFFGDIPPGQSKYLADAFAIRTPPSLTNGASVRFRLHITDGAGNHWKESFALTGATPVLTLSDYDFSDPPPADGDAFVEPGETITLTLNIKNDGLSTSSSGTVVLSSADAMVRLSPLSIPLPMIAAGQSVTMEVSATIAETCPMPKFIPIQVRMTSGIDYSFNYSLVLPIGVVGFRDDMENGPDLWSHSGEVDLWHLSSARSHSGKFSWYCGDEQQRRYQNFMENTLTSQPFVIEGHSQLSFWCWYQCPNYGVNGIYPEVNDGSGWQKLDFIGSGGALPMLPTGNDWLEYTYDLSHFPAGTTLQVRFRFVSDKESVTEGVFIDDVVVCSKVRSAVPEEDHPVNSYELLANYPNPFNTITTIRFYLSELQPTTLTVYDVHGRQVATLIKNTPLIGKHSYVWDARALPSGVYFYRLQSGRVDRMRKCLLLR